MSALSWIDVAGFWIGIFLTFCVLSYLYKDNPFYKLSEHLFVGVSIGYVTTQQYYNVIRPNLLDHLATGKAWHYLIPLVLALMLFTKAATRKMAWVGRYPLAFVVALYAGLQINAVAESDLAQQVKVSAQSVVIPKKDLNDPKLSVEEMSTLPGFSPPVAKIVARERAHQPIASLDDLRALPGLTDAQRADLDAGRGSWNGLDAQASVKPGGTFWFGIVSKILLLIGLCASLWYFYFSLEQKGVLRKVSKFGVWVLMIGFGASFGYTVQGRLALAVGRAMDMLDKDKDPRVAAQIHGPIVSVVSIFLILAGILYWEKVWKPRHPPRGDDAASPSDDEDLPAY
jgi:hypothetical protein